MVHDALHSRFVQLCRQLDDCTKHQAEPLHCARPPVRNQVHLHCESHKPGGKPQQRASKTQNQQYVLPDCTLPLNMHRSFFEIAHLFFLFSKVSLSGWTQSRLTESWGCPTTTWRWRGTRRRPKRATVRTDSRATAATAWQETSTSTAGATTGKLWLEEAHGKSCKYIPLCGYVN